jgi:hypothetical protein
LSLSGSVADIFPLSFGPFTTTPHLCSVAYLYEVVSCYFSILCLDLALQLRDQMFHNQGFREFSRIYTRRLEQSNTAKKDN